MKTRCAALAAASLLLLTGGRALARQYHYPVTVPPQVHPDSFGGGTAFYITGDYASLSGPGVRMSGWGGGWGIGVPFGESWAGRLHSQGFVLDGVLDPGGLAGRKDVSAISGALEFDLVRRLGSGAYAYFGGQAATAVTHFDDNALFQLLDGRTTVTPDTAISVTLGFPLGLRGVRELGDGWSLDGSLGFIPYLGGATLFTYSLFGPAVKGEEDSNIHPFLAGSAGLRLMYRPLHLSLEALLQQTTGSGNNVPLTAAVFQAAVRFQRSRD